MAGNVKQVNCPSCHGTLSIRGMGQTSTMGCPGCGSLFDIKEDSTLQIVDEWNKAVTQTSLPLGLHCEFDGTKYQIIGCLIKYDRTSQYSWEEYLLFNPYEGFAWLAQSDGHFNFFKMVKDIQLKPSYSEVEYNGRSYRRFLDDKPSVAFVIGEFYWKVRTKDQTSTTDFICPPYMLSCEDSDGERVWSAGRYIERNELKNAFVLPVDFPDVSGIGMNQPNHWKTSVAISAVFWIFCAIAAGFIHSVLAPNVEKKLQQTVMHDPILPTSTIVTDDFVIDSSTSLQVEAATSVNNSWVDYDLAAINQETGERDESSVEVSYYHGVDSDGAWTEGSTSSSVYFAGLPKGRYRLSITPNFPQGVQPVPSSFISVTSGAGMYSNLVVVQLLILAPIILMFMMSLAFESKRNQLGSDYYSVGSLRDDDDGSTYVVDWD